MTTEATPNKRWNSHKAAIKHNNGCPLLTNAFKKYGIKSFKFEIIIICFDEDSYKYEKEYIKKYNSLHPNGYNYTEGGEPGGNFKNKTHNQETRKILSEKAKEWNKNNKEKLKILVSNGLKKSDKWKKAIEEKRIGTHPKNKENKSDETKSKISNSLKKYYESSESINKGSKNKEKHSEILTRVNGRKMLQYSLNNELLASFDSINLAAKHTGIGRRNIQANAAGRSKTAGGYIWKYKSINE